MSATQTNQPTAEQMETVREPYTKGPAATLNSYQERAIVTAIYPGKGTPLGLTYCALKLSGEAGEVAEKVGKAIRDENLFPTDPESLGHGVDHTLPLHALMKPDRRAALKSELGDVLWYVAAAAQELGYTLEDVAQGNLDKLADRKARGVIGGSGDNR